MLSKFFILLIRVYQKVLSPFIGNQCRFSPTCSCYAVEAIERHGALKGSVLALLRLLNCHPYSKRPFIDPVPEQIAWSEIIGYKRFVRNKDDNLDKSK